MFIGYANNHAGDCYQMWNPVTNQVSKKQHDIFLQRMFYQGKNSNDVMKYPTMMLQVPHRNNDSNGDSNDGVIDLDVFVLNSNYISHIETREGIRVTFEANSNAKKPNEASVPKYTI